MYWASQRRVHLQQIVVLCLIFKVIFIKADCKLLNRFPSLISLFFWLVFAMYDVQLQEEVKKMPSN